MFAFAWQVTISENVPADNPNRPPQSFQPGGDPPSPGFSVDWSQSLPV
jgi:hypothetical protein